MEEQVPQKPKKSIWDIIDTYLPSATAAYGKIREQKTGVNPFGFAPDSGDDERQDLDTGLVDDFPTGGRIPQQPKQKSKTLWYVLGGVALIGLGVGTYFLIKKNKNV